MKVRTSFAATLVQRTGAATFQAEGCVPSMAAGSWLTEWAVSRTLEELRGLSVEDVQQSLGGLPTSKKHAAYLVTDVVGAVQQNRI